MKTEPMIMPRILVLMRGSNNWRIIGLLLILLSLFSCNVKEKNTKSIESTVRKPVPDRGNAYRIMFYNVENLFDIEDDSLTRDEEFTPKGARYWTNYKYSEKLKRIYKVIVAVGEWELPEIIGLCEVENRKVLNDLLKLTPLFKEDYGLIHKESPDSRGIDVALLYKKNKFFPLYNEFCKVNFPESSRTTRDVLYVKGKTQKGDTLHIFVNHWPSRWGGQLESEPRRMFVAGLVRQKVDSIFNINRKANIILTGDFNDEPENRSIYEVLNAKTDYNDINEGQLYNISYYLADKKGLGSHKYQGNWGMLDQFIVSGNLLNNQSDIHTSPDHVHIFKSDFLLEKDETNVGFKPFRTFVGFKYNGGYSDHLPTYLDLIRK